MCFQTPKIYFEISYRDVYTRIMPTSYILAQCGVETNALMLIRNDTVYLKVISIDSLVNKTLHG